MLVENGLNADVLSLAETVEHAMMDFVGGSADNLMNAPCTFDGLQPFSKECAHSFYLFFLSSFFLFLISFSFLF